MSVLGGPFVALTASTAVFDSVLIDWDSRLRILEDGVDDRHRQEFVRNNILKIILGFNSSI